MTTHRIETRLDEATVKELDGWRSARSPEPSRSEAVRLLLEERLCRGRRVRDRRDAGGRSPEAARLAALYALELVSGFGPAKFRALHEAGIDPASALKQPDCLPFKGRTGDKLRRGIESLSPTELDTVRARANDQVERAQALGGVDSHARGSGLSGAGVREQQPRACALRAGATRRSGAMRRRSRSSVRGTRGSRTPPPRGRSRGWRRGMAFWWCRDSRWGPIRSVIRRPSRRGGATVCVMPCGLDNVFPPESRELWEQLLHHPKAVFVSEFGFGQRASSLLLRKRNKLIVAFVQGVLVAQSAVDGGAMNAYRFGREQRKPVATFLNDGSKETTGNAAIENDARTGRFGLEVRCRESDYEAWLQTLSSWT